MLGKYSDEAGKFWEISPTNRGKSRENVNFPKNQDHRRIVK
jgi:hypothetical protein